MNIKRRHVLGAFGFVGLAAAVDFLWVRVSSKRQRIEPFTPSEIAILTSAAQIILPASLETSGQQRVTSDFVRHVMGHDPTAYTRTPRFRVRGARMADDRVANYKQDLLSMQRASRSAYSADFTSLEPGRARALVEKIIDSSAPQSTRIRSRSEESIRPSHVLLALLAWFFNSSEAYDMSRGLRISMDECRSLVGVDAPPAPL